MNYHEMTMDEPRNSPARKKQYLVICTVMAGMFLHSMITAGVLSSLDIQESIFPGGDYIYRLNQRDYAATLGLLEEIASPEVLSLPKKQHADLLYALYLDNPSTMNARSIRFGTGILIDGTGKAMKEQLLAMNDIIDEKLKGPKGVAIKKADLTHMEKFRLKKWKVHDLPSVDAAVLQFPHTGGFISALFTAYRIIPALRKYAKEKGEANNIPVVISTCSSRLQMCTHYAPLVQGKDFLLGQVESEAYGQSSGDVSFVNWEGVYRDAKRFFPPLRYILK